MQNFNNFLIYRDLENLETYICETENFTNSLRNFEINGYKYGVTIIKPQNTELTNIIDFINTNNKFAQILYKNKKELTHTEKIYNINGEAIDRCLSHLVGDITIDGINQRHLSAYLRTTIDINNTKYIIYLKSRSGCYVPALAAGHVSSDENDFKKSLKRELEEEVGIFKTINEFEKIASIQLVEIKNKTKINADNIEAYHIKLNKSDIPNFNIDKGELKSHILVKIEDLGKLYNGENIKIDYIIDNAELVRHTESLNINQLNGLIKGNPDYIKLQFQKLNNT